MKSLDINGETYMFETLEQLIEMLKEDKYIVDLKIKKVSTRETTTVLL